MVWFKVDDGFHQHPKAVRAGNAALGLWVRCGAYCSHYGTDGLIPTEVAHQYGSRHEIETLVRTTLWTRVDGGFLMPDFLDYNPSRAQVQHKRKADRERKRESR